MSNGSVAERCWTVDPGGLNLVTRYAYEAGSKRQLAVTNPGGTAAGDTPSTRRTTYYRAGTGSGVAACDNRPEFTDLVCREEPGGQPGSGAALPARVTTYDMFGQRRKITESTSAGVLRTSVTEYDVAGRPVLSKVDAASDLGTPVPTTRTVYDPRTGDVTRRQSLDANGLVTAEIVQEYDARGRLVRYTDADGNTSTYAYDALDRMTTNTDGKATRTYEYDGGTERRGLGTAVLDSQGGRYEATYDADGGIDRQVWPNGITVATRVNEAGEAVGVTYEQTGCAGEDCVLFTEDVTPSVHGQRRAAISTLSMQEFDYDNAGRTVAVRDVVDANCITRTYRYDARTNRTDTTSYNPAEDGSCQTETAATQTKRDFDAADRLVQSGYEYDSLGRTLKIPAVHSAVQDGGDSVMAYHTTDMVRKISQDDRTSTYTLDVIGSRIRALSETRAGTTVNKNHHYSGDGDSPSWTDEGNNVATRPILGVSGLAAVYHSTTGVTALMTNLHGDVVAGVTGTTQGISFTSDYLDDGSPRDPAEVGTKRYGWLGGGLRASDTPNGTSLLGVRLYNPATTRFLSTDSVYGGNANAYDYCSGV